jgi:phospholipase/lecithinase/hemolysin
MADLYPVVNAMAASGIGFSCTDVTNKTTGADLTYAQHMLLGQIDSTPNGPTNTWGPGGPVLLGGNSSSWPTAQPQDWQPGNNAAQVEAVLKIAYTMLQADHVSIAMASESDFNLKDFYSTSAGNGYIVNGLLAAGGIPS